MKLSSKLPKYNGLDNSDLPQCLVGAPQVRRLLVLEVVTDKIEKIFDEESGYDFDVPTARIVSAEWVSDHRDATTVQVIKDRAESRRTGKTVLPGMETAAQEFRDSVASKLSVGESLTISAGGQSVTIEGERVDPDTGEVLDQ